MVQITNEHLKFLEESKQVFENEPLRVTHINEDETLISLRFGEDRDCISIYRLDGHVAFFAQQIDPVLLSKKVIEKVEF